MKKNVLIVVATLGLVITVLGVLAPKEQIVERSLVITKPVDLVYDYLGDMKNMEQWGPWIAKDKNAVNTYKGAPGTLGHTHRWESTLKDVGVGEQEITKLIENKKIVCELRFEKPFESKAIAYYNLQAVGKTQTKVTWGCEMKFDFITSIIMLFMDVETELGNDFSQGLQNLNKVIN